MIENHIVVQKTARYYTIGMASTGTTEIWICLHGYRQSGSFFGSNFEHLEAPNRLIVIPEALNRFYIEGYSGRIGNAWMTTEDRAAEIADYCFYLDNLVLDILSRLPQAVKINVLAFSQGTATASRWIMESKFQFDRLVCYAGKMAFEICKPDTFQTFPIKMVEYYIGDKDEFVTPDQLDAWRQELDQLQAKYTITLFEGRHKVYAEVLTAIFTA